MKRLVALIAGLIFGVGLTVSQMVDPNKVLNFLDITGNWDGSLIFVMAAATIVFSTAYWLLINKRTVSLSGNPISLPNITGVNRQLIIGATIFGLGWGLTGVCPGPVIANITGGEPKIFAFIVVMVIGMKASEWVKSKFLTG